MLLLLLVAVLKLQLDKGPASGDRSIICLAVY